MQDAIQLGSFIVKIQWLVLAISCALGYFILSMRIKAIEPHNKVVRETIIDSFLITILVWKLSLILFKPVTFVNNPQS